MNTTPEAIHGQRQRGQREDRYSGWSLPAGCFGPCSRTAALAARPEPAQEPRAPQEAARPSRR